MLLALLLVLTMILSGCSLIVKDEAVDAARVVIRVGDDTYTKAQVLAQIQNQVNYMTALYSRYGLSFDSTNADVMSSLTDNVLNSLVERSVLLAKAKELGLDQLTDEEKTKIEEDTASQLDSLRQSAATEFSLDLETQLEEINAKLDEIGYTEEVVRKGVTESLLISKAEDYAVKDVTVTEDEIVADFNSKVEAAKTSYESDLSAYGKAVLNGTTVYYRPAGYRNVKQILIKYSDEDSALVSNIQTALDNVITEQNNAANVMAKLGGFDIAGLCGIFLGGALEGVPVLADELANQVTVTLKPATETPTATVEVESSVSAFEEGLDETVAATAVTIAEAKAKRAFLEQQLADAKAKALANITPEADEVLAALAEGQDWDTLAEAHNDDPGMKAGAVNAATGYPVCEGFTQFDAAFVEGAMALQKVGDYSDKIEGSYGYYIIQYTSDVVEGAVDMETVHDTISSSLLSSKQSTVRDEVVAQWVKDANATINKDILND